MTTARQATTPEPELDFSLIDGALAHRETPTYVRTAVEQGHFIMCSQKGCRRILGVGMSHQAAESDAAELARKTKDGRWLCPQHGGR